MMNTMTYTILNEHDRPETIEHTAPVITTKWRVETEDHIAYGNTRQEALTELTKVLSRQMGETITVYDIVKHFGLRTCSFDKDGVCYIRRHNDTTDMFID